jgi:hypothetical protein
MKQRCVPLQSSASDGRASLRSAAVVVAASLAMLQVGIIQARSAAADVVSLTGSAFGSYANVSLFGGPFDERGPSPAVTLPASGGFEQATQASGSVVYGPATFFTSGPLDVRTDGTTGPTGSVTSTTSIQSINTSGNEVFTAAEAASSCTASESGVTGSTTITNGTLQVSEGDPGVDGDEVVIAVPVNPAPNTSYDGQLESVGDHFRYVFNEQIVSPDGSLTVNAAHQYLLGPTAVGDLIIGQAVCGVAAAAGSNRPPAAADDSYSTAHNTPLTVAAPGLLGNDSDPDGDPLTAGTPTQPAHGTLQLNTDGAFTYTPSTGFSGVDTFTYMATDPFGGMDTATVTITVAPAPAGGEQSVAGTKFYDANTNGSRDAGEPGVADWLIDITSSAGSQTAVTGADGGYSAAVPDGAVRVAERLLAGWLQTAPPEGDYDVTVGSNQHVTS